MANYNSAVNRKCVPYQKYGYLTISKFITEKNMWECTCICGKIVYRQGNALLKYKNPNCGCKKGTYAALPDQLAHKRSIITDYKRHARERNLDFNLTEEQASEIILKDCFYCGAAPSNKRSVKPSRKIRNKYACNITTLLYNGIDRVSNIEGYNLANCVPCCSKCNWSKKDFSLKEWKDWLRRVYQKTFNDQSKDVGSCDPKQESPSSLEG